MNNQYEKILFEDDRLLITIQDVMVADISPSLLSDSNYRSISDMDMLPVVQVLNKATDKVFYCPLEKI